MERNDELFSQKIDEMKKREKSMIKIIFTRFAEFLNDNDGLKKKLLWEIIEEREKFLAEMAEKKIEIDHQNELNYLLTEKISKKFSEIMMADSVVQERIAADQDKYKQLIENNKKEAEEREKAANLEKEKASEKNNDEVKNAVVTD